MKIRFVALCISIAIICSACGGSANSTSQNAQSVHSQPIAPTIVAVNESPVVPSPEASETQTELPTMSEEEIVRAIEDAEVATSDARLVIQDDEYKAIYPDLLTATVTNNSADTIKNYEIVFLAYDENGYPIKIKGQMDFTEGSYEYTAVASDANIPVGSTHGEDTGLSLDETTGGRIGYVMACVQKAELYNGDIWENPYYQQWLDAFMDKPLPDFLKSVE